MLYGRGPVTATEQVLFFSGPPINIGGCKSITALVNTRASNYCVLEEVRRRLRRVLIPPTYELLFSVWEMGNLFNNLINVRCLLLEGSEAFLLPYVLQTWYWYGSGRCDWLCEAWALTGRVLDSRRTRRSHRMGYSALTRILFCSLVKLYPSLSRFLFYKIYGRVDSDRNLSVNPVIVAPFCLVHVANNHVYFYATSTRIQQMFVNGSIIAAMKNNEYPDTRG